MSVDGLTTVGKVVSDILVMHLQQLPRKQRVRVLPCRERERQNQERRAHTRTKCRETDNKIAARRLLLESLTPTFSVPSLCLAVSFENLVMGSHRSIHILVFLFARFCPFDALWTLRTEAKRRNHGRNHAALTKLLHGPNEGMTRSQANIT